jgi:hypothetical protein
MRRFFSIIFLANSFFSFADYYKPEDPEYQEAKKSGEEKAAEEVKALQEKIKELDDLLPRLMQNVDEQIKEYKKLNAKLTQEKASEVSLKKPYENPFDSETEENSSDDWLVDPSIANTFKRERLLYEGWLSKKRGGKKDWVKRWVILTTERLAYYNNKEKEICINQVPKNKFKLIFLRNEGALDINMRGPSARLWHFRADDGKIKNFWLEKFKIFKPSKEDTTRRKSETEKLEREEEIERIKKGARYTSLEEKIKGIIKEKDAQIARIQKMQQDLGRARGALYYVMTSFFNYSQEE